MLPIQIQICDVTNTGTNTLKSKVPLQVQICQGTVTGTNMTSCHERNTNAARTLHVPICHGTLTCTNMPQYHYLYKYAIVPLQVLLTRSRSLV